MRFQNKLSRLISWMAFAKDPQHWISLIAVTTLLGLCAGAFDAQETAPSVEVAQQPAGIQLALLPAVNAHRSL